MRRLIAIALSVTLLAACGTPAPGPFLGGAGPWVGRPGPEVVYICDDLTTVTVQPWTDSAVATLNSGLELRLPQLPSMTGYRFGSTAYEFRSWGNGAVWTVPQRAPVPCRDR